VARRVVLSLSTSTLTSPTRRRYDVSLGGDLKTPSKPRAVVVPFVLVLGLLAAPAPSAAADKVRIRIASIAPQGSIFAIEAKAASRELEAATNGAVELKWYFGGIFGDDLEALNKVRAGQLEGIASATLCHRLAPSMRVLRMVGAVQTLDEAEVVIARMKKQLDDEFADTGFVSLGTVPFGSDIIFSRNPVASLADLRKRPLWAWSLEGTFAHDAEQLGLSVVKLPVAEAAKAYDDKKIDGFMGSPALFVGYQWSARTHYFTPIKMSVVPLCVLVSARALEGLDEGQKRALWATAGKTMSRIAQAARKMEDELLAQDLEKQGLKRVEPSQSFRLELFEEARLAHAKENADTKELLAQVRRWIADPRPPDPTAAPGTPPALTAAGAEPPAATEATAPAVGSEAKHRASRRRHK
jgi:TRAP-type C4-dicarboxylate transport system substrate-binding protein